MKIRTISMLVVLLLSLSFSALAEDTFDTRSGFNTITYEANGGDLFNTPAIQSIIIGEEMQITKACPRYAKHSFKGWSISSSAKTVDYLPGASVIPQSDMTLYAVWEEAKDLGTIAKSEIAIVNQFTDAEQFYYFKPSVSGYYRIILSPGEGQGEDYYATVSVLTYKTWDDGKEHADMYEIESFYRDSDEPQELIVELTKDNAYYLSICCASTTKPGIHFILSVDCQFNRVCYEANGGDLFNTPAIQSIIIGEEAQITKACPRYAKHSFKGWSISSSAKTVDYLPEARVIPQSDMTLYAVWEEAKDLGTIAKSEITIVNQFTDAEQFYCFKPGVSGYYRVILTPGEVQEEEYYYATVSILTYKTWGDGKEHADMNEIESFYRVSDEPQELIVELTKDNIYYLSICCTYTTKPGIHFILGVDCQFNRVHYEANGGDLFNTPAIQSIIIGEEAQITKACPRYAKHSFKGWSISSSAKTVDYLPGASVIPQSDMTLYAVWEEAKDLGTIAKSEIAIVNQFTDAEQFYCFKPSVSGYYRIILTPGEGQEEDYYFATVSVLTYKTWDDGKEHADMYEIESFYRDSDEPQELIVELTKDNAYYLSICCASTTEDGIRFILTVTPPIEAYVLFLPDHTLSIGAYAFGSTAVKKIVCPLGLNSIDEYAFQNCVDLEIVVIPSEKTVIEPYAFDGCNKKMVIKAPNPSIAHTFAIENGFEYDEY